LEGFAAAGGSEETAGDAAELGGGSNLGAVVSLYSSTIGSE
jgi:hypothetical protein